MEKGNGKMKSLAIALVYDAVLFETDRPYGMVK